MAVYTIMVGKRFGHWTVIGKSEKQGYWLCKCDCGTTRDVRSDTLNQGKSTCCGANCPISIEERHEKRTKQLEQTMVGKRFGQLTVVGFSGQHYEWVDKKGHHYRERLWDCACDCGNHVALRKTALVSGKVKSCGCLREQFNKKKTETGKKRVLYRSLSENPSVEEMVGAIVGKPKDQVSEKDKDKAILTMFLPYWEKVVRQETTAKKKYYPQFKHGVCPICGETTELVWHHLQAVSNYGGNEPNNMLLLCGKCHKRLHRLLADGLKSTKRGDKEMICA